MNLAGVIESLTDERNLDRDQVVEVVRNGVLAAYNKKYPDATLQVEFNSRSGVVEVFVEKTVASVVADKDLEITVRRARAIDPKAVVGQMIFEPFDGFIGRIEMVAAKQLIASGLRELEQQGVFDEFKEKEGEIVNGRVHKRERAGLVVQMGETMAFLPKSCTIPEEVLRVGYPVRALLKEVLPSSRGDHQLILDRASSDFVHKLLELEIPEIFEGVVEIKQIERIPGYKTKVVVSSNSKEIDPVGTCVGVGGVRIRPILKELGHEKVDLIEYTENLEKFVATALKPAEIDRVEVSENEEKATVWLAQDQRSFAIGKQGQNIALVARLTGLHVQLQAEVKLDDASGLLQQQSEELAKKMSSNMESESEADEPKAVEPKEDKPEVVEQQADSQAEKEAPALPEQPADGQDDDAGSDKKEDSPKE